MSYVVKGVSNIYKFLKDIFFRQHRGTGQMYRGRGGVGWRRTKSRTYGSESGAGGHERQICWVYDGIHGAGERLWQTACQMVWHSSKYAPGRRVETSVLSKTNVSANRRSSKISDYYAVIDVFLLNHAVSLDKARVCVHSITTRTTGTSLQEPRDLDHQPASPPKEMIGHKIQTRRRTTVNGKTMAIFQRWHTHKNKDEQWSTAGTHVEAYTNLMKATVCAYTACEAWRRRIRSANVKLNRSRSTWALTNFFHFCYQ